MKLLKLFSLLGICFLFCGCAQNRMVYGIPGSVWQQLTPEEQQQIQIANPKPRKAS